MRGKLGLLAIAGSMACAGQVPMTPAQKTAIADSVKAATQTLIANANKRDMAGFFAVYSPEAEAKYTENAVTYPSLDALRKANEELITGLETFNLSASKVDVDVLTPDVAVATMSINMDVQATGNPVYKTNGIVTLVMQHRNGSWQVVSSHESDANPAELAKATTPAPVKAKPAPKTPAKAPAKTAPRKK